MSTAVDPKTGTVEVTPPAEAVDWPVIGAETGRARKPKGAEEAITGEAVRILRKCADPEGNVSSTVGLVIGYVQSGKTASFTTVCALAHDNHFPLVIVIGGISVLLFEQSNGRLERDLNILGSQERRWRYFRFDMKDQSPREQIDAALQDWRDPTIEPWRRKTVLISVMKHHGHLDALVNVLRGIDLSGVPTVVVDDEGDQAGLNAKVNKNEQSETYRCIQRLRACLPKHAYLLYTATPQAPLLINMIDALSPAFAEVLTPGADYTGGKVFFPRDRDGRLIPNPYVTTIPASEIAPKGSTLPAAPDSFLDALATFWVGVAVGAIVDHEVGNRSMMVHPHQTRSKHNEYFTWALQLQADWARELGPSGDPDYRAEILARFKSAYDDLATTMPTLPEFDRVERELPRSIRNTAVLEVNAGKGKTPKVEWERTYAHLLVGGQAMDRGFTVEGLTVTYMPRGLGEGSADTVQQRARFFGYKRSYLGCCRVWLEADVRDAFEEYVEHEEHIRELLLAHRKTGLHLREWRRAFFLHSSMRPTRRQVLDVPFVRGNDENRWVDPSRPHEQPSAIAWNNERIRDLLGSLTLSDTTGHVERTDAQRHQVASSVPLRTIYEFLLQLRYPSPDDSNRQTALLLQIGAYLDRRRDGEPVNEDATGAVFLMGPKAGRRGRGFRENGELLPLLQGANPSTGPDKGRKYPGDAAYKAPRASTSDPERLTVQVHRLALHDKSRRPCPAPLDDVYVVAVHVPDEIGKWWLVQER